MWDLAFGTQILNLLYILFNKEIFKYAVVEIRTTIITIIKHRDKIAQKKVS